MSDCTHDLAERETACADGMCPICLARQVAEKDSAYASLTRQYGELAEKWNAEGKASARAEAERDAYRKDAERYRWLRAHGCMVRDYTNDRNEVLDRTCDDAIAVIAAQDQQ